ncbi:AI-2E family transporter [Caloramator sp. CAR-1]|uniref:AI-2E family transporter n=1 Tax=Caloramator sp. CAR-1 TaxID=3062777 RepID=UPI0026E23DA9|nr:AI-2E family transporter [Caloramator sp. CAR-1]MDO6354092.1 AI-2E family transporter [Caloramator sp. CAR-1]
MKVNKNIYFKWIFLIVIIATIKIIATYFNQLFIAFLIAIILQPMVCNSKKILKSRIAAVIISYLFIIFVALSTTKIMLNFSYNVILNTLNNLPSYFENIDKTIRQYNNSYTGINLQKVLDYFDAFINSFKHQSINLVYNTINGLTSILLIVFLSAVISYDFDLILKFLKKYLPLEIRLAAKNVYNFVQMIIIVQLQLVAISFIFMTFSFLLLGYKNALILGIVCSILDILPIVGPALLFIPMIIVEFLEHHTISAIGLIITYILNIFIRQIMEVKLLKTKLKLSPIVIIFNLYLGYVLFGWFGVIIAPVIYLFALELLTNDNKFVKGAVG